MILIRNERQIYNRVQKPAAVFGRNKCSLKGGRRPSGVTTMIRSSLVGGVATSLSLRGVDSMVDDQGPIPKRPKTAS